MAQIPKVSNEIKRSSNYYFVFDEASGVDFTCEALIKFTDKGFNVVDVKVIK